MGTGGVTELVYISAAKKPFSPLALRELLSRARANNQRLGVTGMLLHVEGSFLQVLEGEAATVDALFDRIGADPRHDRILRLFKSVRPARSFGEWSMGFAEPDATARSRLTGFNEFLAEASAKGGLPQGASARIRELAIQFRAGHWRQTVSVA